MLRTAVPANFFGRAAVVDLYSRVADRTRRPQTPKAASSALRVPRPYIRLSRESIDVRPYLFILEIRPLSSTDQSGSDGLFDDVLDLRVSDRRDDVVRAAGIHVRQRYSLIHGPDRAPSHPTAPRTDCATRSPRRRWPARRGSPCAGRFVGFQQQTRDEVQLDGQPRAAVDHETGQESGTREEVVGFPMSP